MRRTAKKTPAANKSRPSPLDVRLANLESRLTEWGPQLDAQFAHLGSRLKTLERHMLAAPPNSDNGRPGIDPDHFHALERRDTELAVFKSQE